LIRKNITNIYIKLYKSRYIRRVLTLELRGGVRGRGESAVDPRKRGGFEEGSAGRRRGIRGMEGDPRGRGLREMTSRGRGRG